MDGMEGFVRRPGFLRRLARSRTALLGAGIVAVVCVVAVSAPVLAPYDPVTMQTEQRLQPPSPEHIMGTDKYGRDVFSRVIWGARVSMTVAISAVSGACVVALAIGLLAGYLGRWVDDGLMRILDIFFAFPGLLLAIALSAFLGPGLRNAVIAIAIVNVPPLSRVVRAGVIAVKEGEYVTAARAVGASDSRIVLRHILPNAWSPLIVQASVYLAYAVLTEASLSFLGLGVTPPAPSWGEMLNTSRMVMSRAPWGAIFPGIMLSLTVLGINFLGDGLRDALDPRLK
jgi:peptide/nickel transport system permease protein